MPRKRMPSAVSHRGERSLHQLARQVRGDDQLPSLVRGWHLCQAACGQCRQRGAWWLWRQRQRRRSRQRWLWPKPLRGTRCRYSSIEAWPRLIRPNRFAPAPRRGIVALVVARGRRSPHFSGISRQLNDDAGRSGIVVIKLEYAPRVGHCRGAQRLCPWREGHGWPSAAPFSEFMGVNRITRAWRPDLHGESTSTRIQYPVQLYPVPATSAPGPRRCVWLLGPVGWCCWDPSWELGPRVCFDDNCRYESYSVIGPLKGCEQRRDLPENYTCRSATADARARSHVGSRRLAWRRRASRRKTASALRHCGAIRHGDGTRCAGRSCAAGRQWTRGPSTCCAPKTRSLRTAYISWNSSYRAPTRSAGA